MNTEQFIQFNAPDAIRDTLLAAIAKRGQYRGYLAPSAPKNPEGRGAWHAFILTLAPPRFNAGALMGALMGDTATQSAFHACEQWVADNAIAINACEPQFRWNCDLNGIRQSVAPVKLRTKGGLVTVSTNHDGKITVDAQCAGGLAIHQAIREPGQHTVTHIASGLSVAHFDSRAQARHCVASLLALDVNWHLSSKELQSITNIGQQTHLAVQQARRA